MVRRTKRAKRKQRGSGLAQSRPKISLLDIIRSEEEEHVKSNRIETALQQNANVNEKDSNGVTPLIALMRETNIGGETSQLFQGYIPQLIGNTINHTAIDGTALHYSIIEEQLEYMMILLANGADINAKNMRGETPLFIAAMKSDYQVIPILIQNGANLNIQNNQGKTPLDIIELGDIFELEKIKTIAALCRHGAQGPNCQKAERLQQEENVRVRQMLANFEAQRELNELNAMIRMMSNPIKIPGASKDKKNVPHDKRLNSISLEDIQDGDNIVVITEKNGSEFFYKLNTIRRWFDTQKKAGHPMTNPGSGSVIENQSQVTRWKASIPKLGDSRNTKTARKV